LQTVVAQLQTSDGGCDAGPPVELPLDITPAQLTVLLNDLLQNEDKQPYSFYINAAEIVQKLRDTVEVFLAPPLPPPLRTHAHKESELSHSNALSSYF